MSKKEEKFLDEDTDGIHTRHPNRNEDKSRERTAVDSRRGSIIRNQETSTDNKPTHDNHVRASDNVIPEFYVLVLSKKHAKLFHGDMSGLKHIEISELPNGIDDVVYIEEKEDRKNIEIYLREVDKTLWTSGFNKSNVPLVLAGVEYVVAIYKEISQYKHIMDKCVCGSIENEDPKVIYRKAIEIMNPAIV